MRVLLHFWGVSGKNSENKNTPAFGDTGVSKRTVIKQWNKNSFVILILWMIFPEVFWQ